MYTQEQLSILCDQLLERLPDLLELFHVDYQDNGNKYSAKCPAHVGADNTRALNIYQDSGLWRCRTHSCHKKYQPSLLGFIRAVLSRTEKEEATFHDAIAFAEKFLNKSCTDISVNYEEIEKQKFITLNNSIKKKERRISKDIIREKLEIPADFYLKKDYPANLLQKYDIGLCTSYNTEMSNRIVVPIFDETHTYMIGCTGRNKFDKCPKCNIMHNPKWDFCPDSESALTTKWRHSKGFSAEDHLFNYWFAKKYIEKTKVAILCESPGDVLRLEQAFVHNSLGIFGSDLNPKQRKVLDHSGCLDIIVMTNNDNAGQQAADQINKICRNLYNLHFPKLETNDIGDMSVEDVKTKLVPYIKEIEKKYE